MNQILKARPSIVVLHGTRPDIPSAVGRNLERYFWIIVLTETWKHEANKSIYEKG